MFQKVSLKKVQFERGFIKKVRIKSSVKNRIIKEELLIPSGWSPPRPRGSTPGYSSPEDQVQK